MDGTTLATLHWIYVFTVFGGEAENIVYTLYLDCICSVFGALYLLCIWSEARYIVYTLYLELLGLYIQSRVVYQHASAPSWAALRYSKL